MFLSHNGTAAKRALSESGSECQQSTQCNLDQLLKDRGITMSHRGQKSCIEKASYKTALSGAKRTDRSGRRFILLLLNLGGLLKSKDNAREFRTFSMTLFGVHTRNRCKGVV